MPVPSVIFSLLCRHCYPLLSICDAAVAVAVVEQLNAVVCFCVVVCVFVSLSVVLILCVHPSSTIGYDGTQH